MNPKISVLEYKDKPSDVQVETSNCIVEIVETDATHTTVYIDTKNGDEVYMLRVVGNLKKGLNVYDW